MLNNAIVGQGGLPDNHYTVITLTHTIPQTINALKQAIKGRSGVKDLDLHALKLSIYVVTLPPLYYM